MKKKTHIALAILLLGAVSAILPGYYFSSTRTNSKAKDSTAMPTKEPPATANALRQDFFEDLLRQRCDRENIELQAIAVRAKGPSVPAQFSTEAEGPWPKVISKLEERFGYVPVYEKGQAGLTNAPSRIVQIGRYLYFGKDEMEIAALRALADGGTEERSAALDQFGDDSEHAVPLFLALQKGDPDAQIRIEAAQKLEYYPSKKVIDGLVRALGDEEEAVQSAARTSLVWIGDEQVLRALRVAVNDKNETIAEMAQAILKENLEQN